MINAHRILSTVLTCVALAASAGVYAADNAPSQSDIAAGLKLRGLPTVGTAPAPHPGTGRMTTPASVESAPSSSEPEPSAVHPARRTAAAPRQVNPPADAVTRSAVSLHSITFKFGSAELKPESIQTLKNLGNALNQELKDQKVFVIEGHTDAVGTQVYNDELSKRRAETVKDYLVREMGVSPDRLQAVGKGSTELANPKNPRGGENRRVVVVNLGS